MNTKLHRRGSVNQGMLLAGGSLAVMAGLVAMLAFSPDTQSTPTGGRTLVVYCAAGIKPPVEAAARAYQKKYGINVQLQYGGSGTLLSNIRVASQGDLYLAADESYIELARKQDLVAEAIPLAKVRAVIVFPEGNPKNIQSLDDLARDDVTVCLANPEAASIGKLIKEALQETGQWSELEKRTKVFKPTVNEVANDVKIGAVDAGIVWDATARQYPGMETIRVPVFDAAAQEVTIAVLNKCKQPRAALHFARYLGARDRGLLEFEQAGYEPVDGDVWAESPEVTLFSGGVNRLAIEDTVAEFQEREGVRVNVIYNGCGILVGMMKGGQRPDAYFACDTSFMTSVADAFLDPLDVSETPIVLLVPKGNPKNLQTMADLTRPGLKLGMTNEEQSALGALAKQLFEEAGLYEDIAKNLHSRTPTADLLVNQMRTGSLDAVIVYEANTAYVREMLDVVPIDHPSAKAVQPFAVGREAQHKHTLGRLRDAITSAQSQQRFESVGFGWKVRLPPERGTLLQHSVSRPNDAARP